MKNILVKLGVTLGVFALMFSFASPASAALTLGALTITSDGALTMATTGAFTVPTITLANGETIANSTNGIVALGGNLLVNGAETDATSGYEQFFKATGNFTGVGVLAGAGSKTWALQVDGTRLAGANVLVGDSNDMGVKVSVTNKADNSGAAGYYMRGLDVSATNRDSGSITNLFGGHISATQKGSSDVDTDLKGLTVKVEADSPNTAPTNVFGIDVEYDMVAPTGTPTLSAGVRVLNNSDIAIAASDPLAGFMVDNGAADRDWQYGLYIDDSTIGTADIRLSSGVKIFTGSAANGDAVYAEVGAVDATGSLYITTAGALYVQVANTGAATDWFKVTTTDAD